MNLYNIKSIYIKFNKLLKLLIIKLYILYIVCIYSQLSVSRTTDKSDFSISRTHLVGLVGFVSSSMLN